MHASAVIEPLIIRGPERPDLLRQETLPDLFEETARRQPEQIALIFGDRQLTYGELDHAANRAAHHLIEAGVRPGQLVGLWLPRGIDLLVMQLAIAKAGAGWLPMDADTPIDRIRVCLDDANATALVLASEWLEAAPSLPIRCFGHRDLELEPDGSLRRRDGLAPHHPAYVIYTSGSTGKPKGILINQGSICHFLRSENSVLGIRAQDRVYQGFSVAFDMSFEEIWISYLVGASVWIAPKCLVSDPDALPDALELHRISVLHAVPTLLALFPRDVPGLRIINLGGEMCPDALVDRWAGGTRQVTRQVFNTYGPTEATVSASLAELRGGEPVTIGKPLPNYGLLVLGENKLPLGVGETGELCIFGPGVALGYLGRPELTAEKFIPNPWACSSLDTRLYRTGDLARIDASGQVHCLGRVDDQVKIRGFRVELGEIEALLCQQPGIGTAAVVVRPHDGVDQLVAFFSAERGAEIDRQALRAGLKLKLPPYMVPTRFEPIEQMPRLTSGKIDRKVLRALPLRVEALDGDHAGDVPQSDAEVWLFELLGQLFPGQPLLLEADFFDDLGGHSLLAARLVSRIRADARFAHVAINDIYRSRTLGLIARAMAAGAIQPGMASDGNDPPLARTPHIPVWRRWSCGLAQALVLPQLIWLRIGHWLAPFFVYHYFTGDEGDSIWFAIGVALLTFVGVQLLALAAAIVGCRLILAKIKPGRYPLWSITYFRWWLSDRLGDIAPSYLLSGSPLQIWYLRALGATIGKDVVIGSIRLRVPSLLNVGDGASIGNAVNLDNARVERGELHIAPISIGHEAYVGSYAVMEGNTSIGDLGRLDGLSALADGRQIGPRERWAGSPARKAGLVDPLLRPQRPKVSTAVIAVENLFYAIGAILISVLFFIPIFPTFILVDWLDENLLADFSAHHSSFVVASRYFLLALPASALLTVLTALLSAAVRWSVLPRMSAGSWPVHSSTYFRKWLANQIQECSLQVLHGVYATVYAPMWYRLLGAHVGKNAEISTALGVVPDMLTLGDETFIADAVMLGDDEVDSGWMTLQPTVIGHRSFVGNGAYVPDGTVLPENVLIGVQTCVPANDAMRAGDIWMGSPALRLPARETLSGFPSALTFHPSWRRRLARASIEAVRIVLPLSITIGVGYLIVLESFADVGNDKIIPLMADLAIGGLAYGFGAFALVLSLKWLLLGRYRPRAAPMWTMFVWLSEAVTNLYEAIAVPNFLDMLRGTPMIVPMLRLLGAKIGRNVYLDTTDITEFDCVDIGDRAEINAWAGPQTHLFEDRVMKIGRVRIGADTTIRARSTVLYDAEIGDGAMLGPLTLVLKGEKIPPHSAWLGSPAQPGRR